MSESLYLISVLWKDDTEELTIICPSNLVIGIIGDLPIMLIERIKIVPNVDAI